MFPVFQNFVALLFFRIYTCRQKDKFHPCTIKSYIFNKISFSNDFTHIKLPSTESDHWSIKAHIAYFNWRQLSRVSWRFPSRLLPGLFHWTCWELNLVPFACQVEALPLSHTLSHCVVASHLFGSFIT